LQIVSPKGPQEAIFWKVPAQYQSYEQRMRDLNVSYVLVALSRYSYFTRRYPSFARLASGTVAHVGILILHA
jgi:hypothetical protein